MSDGIRSTGKCNGRPLRNQTGINRVCSLSITGITNFVRPSIIIAESVGPMRAVSAKILVVNIPGSNVPMREELYPHTPVVYSARI